MICECHCSISAYVGVCMHVCWGCGSLIDNTVYPWTVILQNFNAPSPYITVTLSRSPCNISWVLRHEQHWFTSLSSSLHLNAPLYIRRTLHSISFLLFYYPLHQSGSTFPFFSPKTSLSMALYLSSYLYSLLCLIPPFLSFILSHFI